MSSVKLIQITLVIGPGYSRLLGLDSDGKLWISTSSPLGEPTDWESVKGPNLPCTGEDRINEESRAVAEHVLNRLHQLVKKYKLNRPEHLGKNLIDIVATDYDETKSVIESYQKALAAAQAALQQIKHGQGSPDKHLPGAQYSYTVGVERGVEWASNEAIIALNYISEILNPKGPNEKP